MLTLLVVTDITIGYDGTVTGYEVVCADDMLQYWKISLISHSYRFLLNILFTQALSSFPYFLFLTLIAGDTTSMVVKGQVVSESEPVSETSNTTEEFGTGEQS